MATSEELLTDYLQCLSIEKGRSSATIEAYKRDIESFLQWMASLKLTVKKVGESDFEKYFNLLRKDGHADSSVARAMSSVRGWFGFMAEEGSISLDPTTRIVGGKRGRTLPKPLEESLMIQLLDSVPSSSASDLRDRALFELLYGTGARVSEVVGISLQDVDFDEELILVTGKGSKQRLVPMGQTLKDALRSYLGEGGRSEFSNSKQSTRLFLNARGGPLTRQGIDLIIHKRALTAGIEQSAISAHVFRHSCATHMLSHGADIRVVQELLGHSSISTTQIYTAVSIASLQKEYKNAHPRAH